MQKTISITTDSDGRRMGRRGLPFSPVRGRTWALLLQKRTAGRAIMTTHHAAPGTGRGTVEGDLAQKRVGCAGRHDDAESEIFVAIFLFPRLPTRTAPAPAPHGTAPAPTHALEMMVHATSSASTVLQPSPFPSKVSSPTVARPCNFNPPTSCTA